MELSSNWVLLYRISGRGVLSIIPLMWGSLFMDGTDKIDDLPGWKIWTVIGREAHEMN